MRFGSRDSLPVLRFPSYDGQDIGEESEVFIAAVHRRCKREEQG